MRGSFGKEVWLRDESLVQEYEDPSVILKQIKDAEAVIQDEIKKIEKVLK